MPWLAHAAGPTAGAVSQPRSVLVLGRLSDDPKAHYEQLKPLLDYVVPRMADVGIREGRILMARDAQQMASYLRRGRVDWVTETAGTAMLLRDRAGAIPLLLTERGGTSRYHTVFFARADSGIATLADLPGRSIAFQRPTSTSAYFAPAGELLAQGIRLELLLSPVDPIPSGQVGYLFARSERNIATWVHKGLADVGVMSNLDWDSPARMPSAFRSDLLLIGRTDEYPRAVEMVRGDMDARVRDRLRQVLVEASADPKAREALRGFFGTTGFLSIDAPDGVALERIAKGVLQVRSRVE
ncbi:MAG: phosphate/phosphite/phosphonate ABC transporter substrate-binding protein [Pseudomonadota bacterium]|nr:phosphate/phosphite/phosphonate ABC transporter substrate-binding protein [Pseudomonadota bacterium]